MKCFFNNTSRRVQCTSLPTSYRCHNDPQSLLRLPKRYRSANKVNFVFVNIFLWIFAQLQFSLCIFASNIYTGSYFCLNISLNISASISDVFLSCQRQHSMFFHIQKMDEVKNRFHWTTSNEIVTIISIEIRLVLASTNAIFVELHSTHEKNITAVVEIQVQDQNVGSDAWKLFNFILCWSQIIS